MAATAEIASNCRLDLGTGRPMAIANLPGKRGAEKDLRERCRALVRHRTGWTADHEQRLEAELDVVGRMGFFGLLVAVADILTYCRDHHIPTAARGSAVSSLVLHVLGGSVVDPVRQGLLFERFLHAGKTAWPDIDLDLPWDRRAHGPLQFLSIEDETGLMETVVLPAAYRRLGERVTAPGPFLVEGTLRRRQGVAHLEVSGLMPFFQRLRPFGM